MSWSVITDPYLVEQAKIAADRTPLDNRSLLPPCRCGLPAKLLRDGTARCVRCDRKARP